VIGDLWTVLPLACLAGGAFVVYVIARLLAIRPLKIRLQEGRNGFLALFTGSIFALTLGSMVPLAALAKEGGPLTKAQFLPPARGSLGLDTVSLCADPGALVVAGIAVGLGMLVALYSGRYLALDRRYETYYPLLLLLVTGLVGTVLATDLFNLYLFCELMSVTAYALVAFRRHTDTAIEAGFKYLIMGSVGTALMLMGISFVYRGAGHLALPIAVGAGDSTARAGMGPWIRAGLACLLVGLSVKSAIVPVHTWLPDAHGRAPSSISAMLSGIVIQSAMYALLKIGLGLGLPSRDLGTALVVLSLLNMTLGNGLALVQTNTKRLLAYSTIAQMGYVMLSVGISLRYRLPAAVQAGFFLLLAHAAMKGLAFLSKGVCHFYCDTTTTSQLRGIARRLPLAAVTLSVALGGLAGVPPLAGFAGKWFVLMRTVDATDAFVYLVLAIFLLNGMISLGYYLPLIGTLFSFSPQAARVGEGRTRVSLWMVVPLVILGGLVLAIGLYPGPWLDWTAGVGVYLLALDTER
jgi:proton-translocating NADH-quinone oxidoreductase chain N